MEKPISIVSLVLKVFATIDLLVFIIFAINLYIKELISFQMLFLMCLGVALGYFLMLGFAQIIQYLKDLVYLKEKE